jgi:hypothetical protein
MLKQCEGCLREESSGCPVFKKRLKECWAKCTDREQYIKEQRELMEYNNGRCEQAFKQAYKNIKRVTKGAVV